MYVNPNYPSKKALKDAVKAGVPVEVFSPGFFARPTKGIVSVEGPHAPEPHKWYARVEVKDGIVIKVKS
jgi:hypothetical protein